MYFKFKVMIKGMPHVGPCKVVRQKVFESGVKFELRDDNGNTWHKREDEIKILPIRAT